MRARLVGVRGAGLGTPGGVVMGCRPEIQHPLQDSAPLFALFHVLYGRPNLSTQPLLLHSCPRAWHGRRSSGYLEAGFPGAISSSKGTEAGRDSSNCK